MAFKRPRVRFSSAPPRKSKGVDSESSPLFLFYAIRKELFLLLAACHFNLKLDMQCLTGLESVPDIDIPTMVVKAIFCFKIVIYRKCYSYSVKILSFVPTL